LRFDLFAHDNPPLGSGWATFSPRPWPYHMSLADRQPSLMRPLFPLGAPGDGPPCIRQRLHRRRLARTAASRPRKASGCLVHRQVALHGVRQFVCLIELLPPAFEWLLRKHRAPITLHCRVVAGDKLRCDRIDPRGPSHALVSNLPTPRLRANARRKLQLRDWLPFYFESFRPAIMPFQHGPAYRVLDRFP
jgi:hypothetical protein